MARKLVCICNFIPEHEIKQAIGKGAISLDHIKTVTGAGTSCGRCHPAIENLLKESVFKIDKSQQRLF
jgi:bacterioferritin-associated ferredoxin